ncbi:MAG: glycoside-pentoside-hexuronide (GPH):cation symporter [Thermodesulfobacteriota bacterium]|nr:glycoside-pentoside-hexuronide (GPH):cation symporter [Thermodesulfobacteriota bacterium]
MVKNDAVPVKEKLAYGVGDFAINIAYTTLNFYILFFLVNVAGLRVEIAGSIFLVARAWDAISDYLMGMISDRTISRFGRRRVYLLFGCIPLGFAFFLLWQVPFSSEVALIIYYFCITLIFNTALTVVAVPYNAMMPEISQDYDERLNISGYRMALSFVGNLVAAAGVALIVDAIFPGSEAYKESYPVMGGIFGIIIVLSILITFSGTKIRVVSEPDRSKGFFESLLPTLKDILKLKEFRIIIGMFLFNMVALDLVVATFIFFLKDVIKVPEDLTFVMMGIPIMVAVLAAPFWVGIGNKLGKQTAYIIGVTYFTILLLFCLVAPEGNLGFVIMIAILAGIGISASQVIPFSIIPDVIEIDEYENGVRREGVFYGVTTFLYKCASALAIALASLLLGHFGYEEASTVGQPESALVAIRILMGIFPGILFLISAWFVKILPINKKRFDEIREVLEQRRKAKAVEN